MRTRDVIVVGASAGGITALPALARDLPLDLPATVLVVQHLSVTSPRHLVDLVQSASRLPVRWAEHGEPLGRSQILIAPPGMHLLVEGDTVVLNDGPRENHAKPSINRLFRSAAAHHGNRTIGVLLTGTLDDGVSGLDAIKRCGGTAIVQDPADAEYPEMPNHAIAAVTVDHIAPLAHIGALLAQLAGTEVPEQPRSQEGDAASNASLTPDQARETEQAMWVAVRVLEESAFTLGSRAHDARHRGDLSSAVRLDGRVVQLQEQASRQRELIRDVLNTHATK